MKLAIFFLGTVALLSGCAVQRYDLHTATPSDALRHDEAQTFWIGGIGQNQTVDASQVCGSASKVARVETEQTAGNVALNLVTFGIYTPRQIRVYCTR